MRRWIPGSALAAAVLSVLPAPAQPAEAVVFSLEDRREYDAAVFAGYLRHPDSAIRRRAALAAGRIRDRTAVPLVVPLLADPDSSVAATAAFALGQIGDTTAVAALAPILTAAEARTRPTVAAEAAGALGRLRSAASRVALEEWLRTAPGRGPGVREAVGAALLAVWRFPRPADPAPVLRWLESPDTALTWRAAYALSRRPDPAAAAALAARAGDRSPLVRSFAMRSLTGPLADSSGVGRGRALGLLLDATRDPDHAVSVNAVRSLGTFPEAAAIDALRRLLAGPDDHLALTAAESLGRLGAPAAASADDLARRVADDGSQVAVRATALAALVEAAPDRARPVAAALSGSPEWRLRAAAGAAAAALGEWTAVADRVRDADPRVAGTTLSAAVEALGDSVGSLRSLLVEAIGQPDPVVRASAANGFARMADPADLPLLMDAYERAQRDTSLNDAALAAVAAIGEISRVHGAAPVRAFFARFGRSRDYLVRLGAIAALGDSAVRAAWGEAKPIEGALSAAAAADVLDAAGIPTRGRIVTSRGTIELELFADDAPLTVRNFAALARRGYFDGQEWPRVVPNFVIQGGDPRGDTSGGPGYAIRDEINRHRYLTGTLGMALSGPDTGGSQWFVTHSPQPHLDGTYTVFGRVVSRMEVADRLLPGDRIERIEVMP